MHMYPFLECMGNLYMYIHIRTSVLIRTMLDPYVHMYMTCKSFAFVCHVYRQHRATVADLYPYSHCTCDDEINHGTWSGELCSVFDCMSPHALH